MKQADGFKYSNIYARCRSHSTVTVQRCCRCRKTLGTLWPYW